MVWLYLVPAPQVMWSERSHQDGEGGDIALMSECNGFFGWGIFVLFFCLFVGVVATLGWGEIDLFLKLCIFIQYCCMLTAHEVSVLYVLPRQPI